jgi:hypothetical protein
MNTSNCCSGGGLAPLGETSVFFLIDRFFAAPAVCDVFCETIAAKLAGDVQMEKASRHIASDDEQFSRKTFCTASTARVPRRRLHALVGPS